MPTLQQLRYFYELTKTEHLTRTAETLFITQTTLSSTIIHLEKELGVKLFDRVGRSLRLNETGREYAQYVKEALMALDNAQAMIEDRKEQNDQSVSVGMTSSGVFANLLQGFMKEFEQYNLRQLDCDKPMFQKLLLDQELDFVLAGLHDIPLAGLNHRLLTEERLYLCVSKKHPMAEKNSVYLAETSQEPFIVLPKNTGFRNFCDSLFEQANVTYRIAAECDYTLRGKMVEAGFGVTLTTNISRIHQVFGNNIVYIPIADDLAKRPIAIFWNPNHYLNSAAKNFLQYVMDSAARWSGKT